LSKTKEELLKSLNDNNESERLYAVEDIMDSNFLDLSIELVKRLQVEKSNLIKNSIISVLQKMENPVIYKDIFELFPMEDPFLRNSAVSIFASYGENSITFLTSYIDHTNKEVRKLVLDSLVEIALKNPSTKNSVLEIMRAHLFDPEINVIITAIEYLGKLEDDNSTQEFIELFHNNFCSF
jgi:HEAT repeat protein